MTAAQDRPERGRGLTLLLGAIAIALLASCSGSGGDGGSSDDPEAPSESPPPATGSLSAELEWSEASGPVAGYRIFESRNGNGWEQTGSVSEPRVTVTGEEGDTLRLRVLAFDRNGRGGPMSDPSETILFTKDGPALAAAGSATAVATAGDEPVESTTGGPESLESASEPAPSEPAQETEVAETDAEAPDDSGVRRVRLDFGGDGATDLLWESETLLQTTRVEGTALETQTIFDRAPAEWDLLGLDDVDGDGLADLLWARESGEMALSSMEAVAAGAPLLPLESLGVLGPAALILATGDFDGDGRAELLVTDPAGLSVWQVAPDAAPEVAAVDRAVDAGARTAGSGDYDGDGRSDLLWLGEAGELRIWLMDGAAVRAVVSPAAAVTDVLASGDFDGDGVDDVATRAADGSVELLLLGSGIEAPARQGGLSDDVSGWSVVGAGDYDGDGVGDLLWQRESQLELWLFGSDTVVPVSRQPDAAWALVPDWR